MTSVEFARFKREVYQKVHHVIFRPVRKRSHNGEAVACGDVITRVIHPGICIHAVDKEEAYCLCGTRGVQANYPCPRCLTHRHSLTNLTASISLRTQSDMKAVYEKALTLPATAAEKLLRDTGLHLVKVSNTYLLRAMTQCVRIECFLEDCQFRPIFSLLV